MKIEQTRVAREERMKVLAEEGKQKQRVAEYQDQLSRKRYDDQLAQQVAWGVVVWCVSRYWCHSMVSIFLWLHSYFDC